MLLDICLIIYGNNCSFTKKNEIQRKKIYGNYPVFPFLHLVLNERTTRGRKSTRLLSEEEKEKKKTYV